MPHASQTTDSALTSPQYQRNISYRMHQTLQNSNKRRMNSDSVCLLGNLSLMTEIRNGWIDTNRNKNLDTAKSIMTFGKPQIENG